MNLPEDPLGALERRDGDPTFDEAWQALLLARLIEAHSLMLLTNPLRSAPPN